MTTIDSEQFLNKALKDTAQFSASKCIFKIGQ